MMSEYRGVDPRTVAEAALEEIVLHMNGMKGRQSTIPYFNLLFIINTRFGLK